MVSFYSWEHFNAFKRPLNVQSYFGCVYLVAWMVQRFCPFSLDHFLKRAKALVLVLFLKKSTSVRLIKKRERERERIALQSDNKFNVIGKGQPVMDWATRLKVAVGAAKGLAYLHEDCKLLFITAAGLMELIFLFN